MVFTFAYFLTVHRSRIHSRFRHRESWMNHDRLNRDLDDPVTILWIIVARPDDDVQQAPLLVVKRRVAGREAACKFALRARFKIEGVSIAASHIPCVATHLLVPRFYKMY